MNRFSNPFYFSYEPQPLIHHSFLYQQQQEQVPIDSKYLKSLQNENQLLRQKITTLEEKLKHYQQIQHLNQSTSSKIKKILKQKTMFACTYPHCQKQYKSNLALNLHIKIKHNGGSIRDRQAYAKLILDCERLNKAKPQIKINFPPNFVENYRKKYKQLLMTSIENQEL